MEVGSNMWVSKTDVRCKVKFNVVLLVAEQSSFHEVYEMYIQSMYCLTIKSGFTYITYLIKFLLFSYYHLLNVHISLFLHLLSLVKRIMYMKISTTLLLAAASVFMSDVFKKKVFIVHVLLVLKLVIT